MWKTADFTNKFAIFNFSETPFFEKVTFNWDLEKYFAHKTVEVRLVA